MTSFNLSQAIGSLKSPILVVGWPGLGNVASSCVRTLINSTNSVVVSALDPRDHFDIEDIEVKNGVCFPGKLPQLLFRIIVTNSDHDLVVFTPESQPQSESMELAQKLISVALSTFNIEKVITFAAISGAIEPEDDPKVSFATTDSVFGEEIARLGIDPIKDQRISGLNGLTLMAGYEKGIMGACLASEIPVWGLHTINPKTTKMLLQTFCRLVNLRLNLDHLNAQISELEASMVRQRDSIRLGLNSDFHMESNYANEDLTKSEVNQGDLDELELLFSRANFDRTQASILKAELDRLGLYEKYEDRFLDIFREWS